MPNLARYQPPDVWAAVVSRDVAVRMYWMLRKGWDYEQLHKFGSHAGHPGHRHIPRLPSVQKPFGIASVTRSCWQALHPFLVEGSYGNYVADEGDPFAGAAYGPNYDRLVALKNKYDPSNFFRMNHNIKPTS